jgi:putative DNA primase/helicase
VSAVLDARGGFSGDAAVRPAYEPKGAHPPPDDDAWSAPGVPDDICAKFSALPGAPRDTFTSPIKPDADPRKWIGMLLVALRMNGWTLLEAIALAPAFPLGFGRLGPHSAKVFAELWAERDKEEAEREREKHPYPGLAEALSAASWLQRTDPPSDRLLGDLITTTIRVFLVGLTGLGKTMLGLAIGIAMALGLPFCHWRTHRPARVLYIDGEMPVELIIQRTRDAARRAGKGDTIPNLMIYSVEDAEKWAEQWPELGIIEPLNTEAGHEFIYRLCDATKPDVVIFDNVQSLILGVQKEEETWAGVNPMLQGLTKRHIGQVYLDHANQSGRQYGTITKGWRADAVGIMSPPDVAPDDPDETAFVLTFDPAQHGKCRRRTPENWQDFATRIFRLRGDEWSSEPVTATSQSTTDRRFGKLGPDAKEMYRIIQNLLAAGQGEQVKPDPDMAPLLAVRRKTVRTACINAGWFPEPELVSSLVSSGLTQKGYDREDRALKALKHKDLIGSTREWVWLL